jgi:hypothetical protein
LRGVVCKFSGLSRDIVRREQAIGLPLRSKGVRNMSKVALSCLTGGELTEYHDNARYMPRARCAEIADHLAECGQCASDYVEVAELDAFIHWVLRGVQLEDV